MLKLKVFITLPDGHTLFCGDIFTTPPDYRGKIQGSFQYSREYIAHPQAFALDPQHLPLGSQEYFADRPEGVHGVFEDALPDDWGRTLLVKKASLTRAYQTVPKLLEVIASNALGALTFESKGKIPIKESSADIHRLEHLVDAAMQFDSGQQVDNPDLQELFSCGSSPGGARPKALIKKEDGSLWIAKIPKFNDSFHVESLEAGCLQMAEKAGLPVPGFELHTVGRRKILLVKRFDVSDQGGRYHMISMKTLLNAEGYYHFSYSHLFQAVQKYSARLSQDIEFLFRQMVFNVAIGNTDDHLKNFCMLHVTSGFQLSPVYDILPDIHFNREHRLSFPQGGGTLPPNRAMLERTGLIYHVPKPDQIINDVFQVVSGWKEIFQNYEVPVNDILRLEKSIDNRLQLLDSQ